MSALLDAWVQFGRNNPNLQQFGQSGDYTTFNGATGCTHTILQRLIKAKTGSYVTHDTISRIASYPSPSANPNKRGLYSGGSDNEVGRVIAYYRLPYKIVFGWSWSSIQSRFSMGPVMLGVRYGYWPEDYGYVYHDVKADGRPGGYAIRGGKTQLYGFETGYHAVLALGTLSVKGSLHAYANEPNHGSPARPEKPPYDEMLASQMARAYAMYGSTGRSLLAWVPTTTFKPKGY